MTVPDLAEFKAKEITNLTIRPGAYVSRPTDIRNLIPSRPIQGVEWYLETVCIEDEVNAEGIRETLAMMLEAMLDHSGEGDAIERNPQKSRPLVILRCFPSVLDLMTETVSRDSAWLSVLTERGRSGIVIGHPPSTA